MVYDPEKLLMLSHEAKDRQNNWHRHPEDVDLGYGQEEENESMTKHDSDSRSNRWRRDPNEVDLGYGDAEPESEKVYDPEQLLMLSREANERQNNWYQNPEDVDLGYGYEEENKSMTKRENDPRSDRWRRDPNEVDLGYGDTELEVKNVQENLDLRSDRWHSNPVEGGLVCEPVGTGIGCDFNEELKYEQFQEEKLSRPKYSMQRLEGGLDDTISTVLHGSTYAQAEKDVIVRAKHAMRRLSMGNQHISCGRSTSARTHSGSNVTQTPRKRRVSFAADFGKADTKLNTDRCMPIKQIISYSAPISRGVGRTVSAYDAGSNNTIDSQRREHASICAFGNCAARHVHRSVTEHVDSQEQREPVQRKHSMSRAAPVSRGVGRTVSTYDAGSNNVVDSHRRRASIGCCVASPLAQTKHIALSRHSCKPRLASSGFDPIAEDLGYVQEEKYFDSQQGRRAVQRKHLMSRSAPSSRGVGRTVSTYDAGNSDSVSSKSKLRRASIGGCVSVANAQSIPRGRNSCMSRMASSGCAPIAEDSNLEKVVNDAQTEQAHRSMGTIQSISRAEPMSRGVGRTKSTYDAGSNNLSSRNRRASIGAIRGSDVAGNAAHNRHVCVPHLTSRSNDSFEKNLSYSNLQKDLNSQYGRKSLERNHSTTRSAPKSRGVGRTFSTYDADSDNLLRTRSLRRASIAGSATYSRAQLIPQEKRSCSTQFTSLGCAPIAEDFSYEKEGTSRINKEDYNFRNSLGISSNRPRRRASLSATAIAA